MNRKFFLKTLALSPIAMHISSLHALENWSHLLPSSEKMPVLFLGHGSPMNAVEDNQFVRGFHTLAKTLPRPNAILCVSAHWYIQGTKVVSSLLPKTIHDFHGFPDALYQIQYPAKGNPELATEVKQLLGSNVSLTQDWGLDHGAWTVLMHLYPDADIPVIQLSIDYTKSAHQHFELAGLLRKLRNKGVLIVGSGNIVHNLAQVDWKNFAKDNYGYDWAKEVQDKVNLAIKERNFQFLIDYEKNGSAFRNAIPSPDHYLPLIYSLALSDTNDDIHFFNDKLLAGSLSMTSIKIG